MKTLRFLFICLLFPITCWGQGAYHEANEFILRAGIMNSNLRYNDNVGFTTNLTYIPSDINHCGIGWNAGFTVTKDFYSLNPLGACSTLLNIFGRSLMGGLDGWIQGVFYAMSAESMGVYIPIGEHFELQPYWSLLRLSKWKKEKVIITGAFGLSASVYMNRFSITGYGEYSFGYGNVDWWGARFNNIFTEEEDTYYTNYEKPCTPFKGWIYGLTLGYSF